MPMPMMADDFVSGGVLSGGLIEESKKNKDSKEKEADGDAKPE